MNDTATLLEPAARNHTQAVHNIIRAVAFSAAPESAKLPHTLESARNALAEMAWQYGEAEKELQSRWANVEAVERVRIEQDLKEAGRRLRQLQIGSAALDALVSYAGEDNNLNASAQKEITGHWIDGFLELAGSRNETWRAALIARALASEAIRPGSISSRTLWVLGGLAEDQFIAFSTFLDLCATIDGRLIIPLTYYGDITIQIPVPDCPLGSEVTIGTIIGILHDMEFLKDRNASIRIGKNSGGKSVAYAQYAGKKVMMTCFNLEISGLMLTSIGETIASFCERKDNPLGRDIFEAWLKSLDSKKCKYTLA